MKDEYHFINASDSPITIELHEFGININPNLILDIPAEIDAELSLLDLMMSEEKRKKLIFIL